MTAEPSGAAKRPDLLLIAGVAAVLVALVLVVVGRRAHRAAGAGGLKRVVVLPFQNLGGAEDDYFAEGLADAVRGKLALLPNLEVIARASSTAYKRTVKTPTQIGTRREVSPEGDRTAPEGPKHGRSRTGQPRATEGGRLGRARLDVEAVDPRARSGMYSCIFP